MTWGSATDRLQKQLGGSSCLPRSQAFRRLAKCNTAPLCMIFLGLGLGHIVTVHKYVISAHFIIFKSELVNF